MTNELKILIERWKETKRIAFVYPKLKQISLNGGKRMSFKDATIYLKDFFKITK